MSDAVVVLTAVSVAASAWLGWGAPGPVVLAVVAVALVRRHPVLVVAALVAVVGSRSAAELAALDRDLPRHVAGVAQLVSDPKPGRFGTSVEVRLQGRRWQAQVPRSDEWVVRPLLTGDHIRVVARPGRLRGAPEGWRRSRHLAGRLAVTELGRGPPAPIWYGAANRVHRTLRAGTASFDDDARALYMGLVVGDDRSQSDVDRFRFRATGLGHLLAVSGQNVAFVLLLVRPLLGRCGTRWRWVLGVAALVAFVLVTRGEASVLRAATMAAVGLLAASSGRNVSGARMLSLAIVALLLVDPLLVQGLGFQLSVCATIGMIVGTRPIAQRLRGPRTLVEAVACTVAAQVATAPLLVPLSGGVPSVATIANVVAVPAAGIVMVLGLTAGLVAGAIAPGAAAVVNLPARVLVTWIGDVAANGSRVPLPLLGVDRLVLLGTAVVVSALRRGRRWPLVVVVPSVLVALWPVTLPIGRSSLGDGIEVVVGPCAGPTVVLGESHGPRDVLDVLSRLQRSGVVTATVVVGPPEPATEVIAEQLGARRVGRKERHGCAVR